MPLGFSTHFLQKFRETLLHKHFCKLQQSIFREVPIQCCQGQYVRILHLSIFNGGTWDGYAIFVRFRIDDDGHAVPVGQGVYLTRMAITIRISYEEVDLGIHSCRHSETPQPCGNNCGLCSHCETVRFIALNEDMIRFNDQRMEQTSGTHPNQFLYQGYGPVFSEKFLIDRRLVTVEKACFPTCADVVEHVEKSILFECMIAANFCSVRKVSVSFTGTSNGRVRQCANMRFHFPLGLNGYLKIPSPGRRMCDLITQGLVKEALLFQKNGQIHPGVS